MVTRARHDVTFHVDCLSCRIVLPAVEMFWNITLYFIMEAREM